MKRSSPRRQAAWYRDYADTLIQRDVRDLARINLPDALPRLLTPTAGQTVGLLNVSELLLIGKMIGAEMPKADKRGAFYAFSLERGIECLMAKPGRKQLTL